MSNFTKVIILLLFCFDVEKLLKQNMEEDIRIDKYLGNKGLQDKSRSN